MTEENNTTELSKATKSFKTKKISKRKIIGLSIGGIFLLFIVALTIFILITLFGTTPKIDSFGDIQVTSVEFNYEGPKVKGLTIGETTKLLYTVYPNNAKNKNVNFKSDDESIATVDSTGTVWAISSGSVNITIETVDGGFKDYFTIVVKEEESDLTDLITNTIENLQIECSNQDVKMVDNKISLNIDNTLSFILDNQNQSVIYNWKSSDNTLLEIKVVKERVNFSFLSPGVATITLEAIGPNGETVKKEFVIEVLEHHEEKTPEVVNVGVRGIEKEYYENDVIDTNIILFIIEYNDNNNKVLSLTDLSDFPVLNCDIGSTEEVTNGKVLKKLFYEYIDEYNNAIELIIEYNVIKLNEVSYYIRGLKKNYYIDEVINTSNLQFVFVIDGNELVYSFDEIKEYLNDFSFDTSSIGTKEVILTRDNQEFIFEYNVNYYEIVQVDLEGFPTYYYLGEDLVFGQVSVLLNNGKRLSYNFNNSEISFKNSFDSSSLGFKNLQIIIDLDNVESEYEKIYYYEVCNPLSVGKGEINSLLNTFDFFVNVNSLYQKDSNELMIDNNSNYSVNKIEKNNNGNFLVSVTLNSNSAEVVCYLKGTTATVNVKLNQIKLENTVLSLDFNSKIQTVNKEIKCTIKITYEGVEISSLEYEKIGFKITGCEEVKYEANIVTIVSSIAKTYYLNCIATLDNSDIKTSDVITYYEDPYYGINFVMGNKKYGIGEIYTLAGLKSNAYSTTPSLNTYKFDVFCLEDEEVDSKRLKWYTSDETIAKFSSDGTLNIVGSGIVSLYVTTNEAQLLGLDTEENIGKYVGKWTVKCINDSIVVGNFNQLQFAFDNNYKVVLESDVYVGPILMTITTNKETGEVDRELINPNMTTSILDSYIKNNYLETTWENSFLLNNNLSSKVYYAVEVTTDIYGNGYTLDCSQYTTVASVLGRDISYFNGPLQFVQLLMICEVFGQDDIGFLIRDNVTIDNVVMQNCDNGYLQKDGKLDYTKLDNVGTVCEIMGDNVVIKNSRIRNGRNIIRIYGKEDPNEVIHATIESSVISNAREFLVKIGCNAEEVSETSVMYNDELTSVRDLYEVYGLKMDNVSKNVIKAVEGNNQLLYSTSSPYLKRVDETNYLPRDDNNLNDEYFVNEYIKTYLTIKNSVLLSTSFFGIAMESKFAGPILGGYKFAPKDINLETFGFYYSGVYDMNGTSFSASLKLVGDVRIYNWKKVNDFNSSTIVKELDESKVANLLQLVSSEGKFEFNISEIITNISSKHQGVIDEYQGEKYAHGGIVLYGGGKNYHIVDLSEYTGYQFSEYTIPMNELGDSLFVRCIPLVAGNEPFRFFMYDKNSELTYKLQQELLNSDAAYENIVRVD